MSRKRGFLTIGSVIVPLLALLLVSSAWAAPRATSATRKEPLAKATIIDHAHFDGNTIDAIITNDGSIVDHRVTGSSGMEWPKGTDKLIDYHSGLWLVGIGHDDGNIYTACNEYSSELVPGPWGSVSADPAYKIYKINRDGTGDWDTWPADQGAPVDEFGDPLLMGDQTMFYVCNDGNVAQHSNVFSTPPMDVETRVTIFGYNRADPLGNIMFIKWEFLHKGTQQFDSCFVALWDDPDLGDASDDLVGCDPTLGLGYCYNGLPVDSDYGDNPPALGFDFFQGPEVPKGSGNYLGMTAFAWYWNGAPDPWDDPEIATEAYWFMNGYGGDGTPYTDHENNPTVFPFSGDPLAGTGHLDGVVESPGDRRFLMSSGPFTLAPGDTQVVMGAKIIAQATTNRTSVAMLKFYDAFAQTAYDGNFQIPSPIAPKVEVAEADQGLALTWYEDHEDVESYAFAGYEFEGYNVYQGESVAGPWHRVATFDAINSYDVVFDQTLDPVTLLPVSLPAMIGSNSGLQRFIIIDEDILTQTSFSNYRRYYFAVTAYLVHPDASAIPRVVETAKDAYIIFPQEQFKKDAQSTLGDSLEVTHEGGSDGSAVAIVLDPYALTGDDYAISFYESDGEILWRLTNTTVDPDSVVLDDQANQSGDQDYDIAEGLLVKVMGPPMIGKEYTYDDERWFSWVDWGGSIFGGAVDLGVYFFGSTLTAADYHTVEIRFSSDPADQTNCKVYRRDLGYAVQPGLGTFPGGAYDMDDGGRRLNIAFVENDEPGVKPANMIWDPDNSTYGGREYLFIMDSDYDATTAGGYDDVNFAPEADVQWAYWPRLRGTHPYLETEGTWTLIPNYVNTANDLFTFNAPAPKTGAVVEETNLDKINVVPNPYFAFNLQERIPTDRFVTFTHLPGRGATIRIFTLSGSLVKVIDDDEREDQGTIDTPMAEWDLRNEGEVPVASGMYIAHIEVDGVGDKILKLAVFTPEERLDYF